MKTLIIASILSVASLNIKASEPVVTASQHFNAERGTAVGVGKSKGMARFPAKRNIPRGANQTGTTKYVKNADGTWTVYVMWVKR